MPFLDLGCPPEALPSPPPIGWSTGFMATPRVLGLLPSQRDLPAFPDFSSWWSTLETIPMVALQLWRIILVSPEGSLITANLPSRVMNWAYEPALRASLAPCPGLSSMLWMIVPKGISLMYIVFPMLGDTPLPETTSCPTSRPCGALIYLFSPPA